MSDAVIDELEDEKLYPSSDGKPMGETDFHVHSFVLLLQALEDLTGDIEQVHVAANMFIYYEEGNSKARKAPDAMVTFGVKRGPRRTFKTWVEKKVPNTVFEVTSPKTKKEDVAIYARIGSRSIFCSIGRAVSKAAFSGVSAEAWQVRAVEAGAGRQSGQRGVAGADDSGRNDAAVHRFADGQGVPTRREMAIAAQDEAQRRRQAEQQAAREKQRAEREQQRTAALEAEVAELKARLAGKADQHQK
jgi:hypothetical protein